MSVDGKANTDAHMDAEGTPINFLNVVEQSFLGATTAL